MVTLTACSKSDCVAWYLERDYVLFPLNGKIPPKNCHWREIGFDPFFGAKNNFGVRLSKTDLIIDVDPRNFKNGVNSFELIKRDFLSGLVTTKVLTSSGGCHFYFKKPADLNIRKSLKEYPGIDFLSDGCYVVGAGSIHPDTGREYILKENTIIDAPAALLKLIEKTHYLEPLKREAVNYADDNQTKQRYTEYLKTANAAIEGESGDSTTIKIAMVGRDYGLSPDDTFELMYTLYNDRCVPPWNKEELSKKVQNAYNYAHGQIGALSPGIAFPKEKEIKIWTEEQDKYFHRTEKGQIKLDKHNIAIMFSPGFPLEGLLAMNLFSLNIIFTKKAPWHKTDKIKIWNDEEAILCSHWLSTNYKLEPKKDMMHESAVVAAYQYQFHPVKQYFEKLNWDGHKRVHNWLHDYLGAKDDQYTKAVGLKTLVACVKRIYEPGCKFDYIPVLEGDQGTGKSTAWKILAGKEWFGDTPIDISKEWSIMKTFGKMMYEWAEMETFRRSNTQAMRAFLSSDTDTVRLPYNRTIQAIPRQGIFVGTFNPEGDRDIGWLHDTTGNRRYWVVETSVDGDIRNDKLEVVRDQLWAEALMLYFAGTPIYFEDVAVIQQAKEEQAKRLGKDPWHDAVDKWLNAPHNKNTKNFSGEDIFKDCIGGNLERYKRPEMSRISYIMRMIGWIKGSVWNSETKKPMTGYRRPMIE